MIDLVLATLGRTEEPAELVGSLAAQTCREFRLIVVDQNPDDRLAPILAAAEQAFPVLHLRAEPGNSRARNVGLRHVRGDVVGFPDDDCTYPPELVQTVLDLLAAHVGWSGVSGRPVDGAGRSSAGRWDRRSGPITRFNVWRRATAATVFLRRSAIERAGEFDETLGLGPGAVWPAAEDLDYVLRAVRSGLTVHYEPSLHVYHGQRREGLASPAHVDGYRYGLGVGRVLRKNGLPTWFAAYYIGRSFVAAAIGALRRDPGRARFYWAVGRGRLRGWRSSSTAS